jgi:hypothetical protein
MHGRLIFLLTLLSALLAGCARAAAAPPDAALPPPADRLVDFARDVRPILAKSCYQCHGPSKQKSGLRLHVKADALKGGDLGPAIIPGKGADSPLVRYVAGLHPDMVMPPKGERLAAAQVGVLLAWINQGAVWPDEAAGGRESVWWSLRPIERPAVPEIPHPASAIRNPIDAFLRAKLQAVGLAPSPEADRRTLIRRLSFDLIGLPPAPGEVDAFLRDDRPDAYERLVDRLLASPHYGERWARHWLDVVHYGDTHGYDKDKPRPNAWPYRDYVIRAFNEDRSYARFVQEQLAGDVLYPNTGDGIEALGFIAAGPWDFIGHAELPETKTDGKIARHLDRDDMVTNTMMTFVSLTVQCAQCHNHKFDPITQEDYYSLQAVFAAVDRADRKYYHDPALARTAGDLEARRRALTRRKNDLDARIAELGGTELADLDRRIAGAPKSAAASRDELRRERRELLETVVDADTRRGLDETEWALKDVDRELAKLPPPAVVYCGTVHAGGPLFFAGTGPQGGAPRPISVLRRGDVRQPLQAVGPGAVAAVAGLPARFDLPPGHAEGERRAALARWVTDPKNPLTWRSIVNRVWRYHFGRGLVDTPNDFGRMGQLPTHSELLDWLAAEFRDGGQSLKWLHRLIVTSAAYRQASADDSRAERIDAENAYLWRMSRRRLEAEEVRDSVLAVSGRLDRRFYGPAFQEFVIEKPEHSPHYEYHRHDPDDHRAHRRSVYRFLVRSQQQPFMTLLDCADPSMQVDRRNETISAPQALTLLNNGFVLTMSRHCADRVAALAPDASGQVAAAFRLALARDPTPGERSLLAAYARKHGVAAACRLIFNLNEFAFVD